MEKIMNMTLQEIIDDGGNMNIYFHGLDDIEEAADKIHKYSGSESVSQKSHEKSDWLEFGDKNVKVSVFFKDEIDEDTEHAQAELTEQKRGKTLYEQKLEDAGHTEKDFL